MKKLVSVLCLMSILAWAAPMALAGQVKWDMPIAWPQENYNVKNAKMFVEAVKKATDGQVNIVIHPGGALGYKGQEMLSVVRDGLAPIGEMLTSQLVGEESFFGIEAVAYLAPGSTQLRLLQLFSRPVYDKLAKKHNQKILYMCPWPGQKVYTKKEIKTLEDLKGLKIRTVDKNSSDFFKSLGASPVQMPWGEVVPALATGAIDGVSTSSSSGVDGKFWEFLSFASEFNWHCASDMVTVNLQAWNKLTPKQREAIETVARELEPVFWLKAVQEDIESLKILTDKGLKVTQPSETLKAQLDEKARAIWKGFIEKNPQAKPVIEGYQTILGR